MRSLEDQEPTSRVRWSTLLERAGETANAIV
jgi:hypothetical protein